MKNLYLIPTDKPSRLCFRNYLFINKDNIDTYSNVEFKNIYITSNEKVKSKNWVLYNNPNTKRTFIVKTTDVTSSYFDYERLTLDIREVPIKWAKNIILTTDQNLIKDGVQAIPDEFLEWFVKNPTYEEIEVIDDKKLSSKNIYNAVEADLVYSHHGHGGVINSLSNDIRVGIGNYVETALTSETGWETLDINNYKIYNRCYKIIIPKEEAKSLIEKMK